MQSNDLMPAESLYLRDRLRAARYAALADAEGFQEVCFAVEAVGMRLTGAERTLNGYRLALQKLAQCSPLLSDLPTRFPALFTHFDALYETVRQARNDAMHRGSYARHATVAAVELCVGFEEALMNAGSAKRTVADYMVKVPIFIEPWQPVAQARQLMLTHSFSFLPVLHQGRWHLLSELAVVNYLYPMSRDSKGVALAEPISAAVTAGLILLAAKEVSTSDEVADLLNSTAPTPNPTLWLVVDKENRLTGVLSPFELM